MGERVAKKLVSRNIIDLIDIDDDYSIVEIAAPAKWVGKTLKALELRTNYGINVLGIRKNPKEHLSISPDAFYTIEANDQLLVIADNKIFKKFESLFRI